MLYILLYIMKLFQINGSVVHPVHKCKVGADLQIFEKQICVSTRRRATTELSVLFFGFFSDFFGWGGVRKVLLFLVFDTSAMVKLCGCQNIKWFRNEHQLQKRILSLLLIGHFC